MKTLRRIWEKLGQKLGQLVDRLVEALGRGGLNQEPALVPVPVREREGRR